MKSNRRNFIKVSAAAGGGMLIGFPWMMGCKADVISPEIKLPEAVPMPDDWFEMSGFIKIGETGRITIMSPNPEIGQNIKTSMPMIVAEELDVDWKDVIVEQAGLDALKYNRQVAGGSQSIRHGWVGLRRAGATARRMLLEAAAKEWDATIDDLTTSKGRISHADGRSVGYGEVASKASAFEVPEDIPLKDPKDYTIIGKNISNVDLLPIVTGKPLFGLDFKREGMVHAVVKRPPAFGLKIKSIDDSNALKVNGVTEVVQFGDKVAVIASSTWAAIKGQKALNVEYVKDGNLENTSEHNQSLMEAIAKKSSEPKRNDGDVDKVFAEADQILERTYQAPFLPHNPLEPMNFFADVTEEKVELIGPIQTPDWIQSQVAELLGRKKEEVTVDLTRMGGGFGRRLYGNFALEAAEVSDKIKKPVKLVYTREDDFASGPYRPASAYKFKAAIKDGEITGYHLIGAGFNMRNACREDWFPAGTLENYRVDSHSLETNIPTGAWRAPVTNFLASAEQSFFDELAHELNKDPIQLRLDLLNKAKQKQVGEIDYEIDKMIGVIEKAKEVSGWGSGANLGFSSY